MFESSEGKWQESLVLVTQHQFLNWTRLTDRGGLYHVEDVVFKLFVALEHVADKELLLGKGLEMVKKEKLSWICDNEER